MGIIMSSSSGSIILLSLASLSCASLFWLYFLRQFLKKIDRGPNLGISVCIDSSVRH